MAQELVRLKVDVIVTSGTSAALAAKRATTKIPIVMATGTDQVSEPELPSLRSNIDCRACLALPNMSSPADFCLMRPGDPVRMSSPTSRFR